MKWRRMLTILAVTLALLAAALYWSGRQQQSGFATPSDCIGAYRDASKEGDVAKYLNCLGEPLRSDKQRTITSQDLLRDMEGVKSWGESKDAPVIQDTVAYVNVDKVRPHGTTPIRFRLEKSGQGWLIVGIEQGNETKPAIPYGTRVGEEPQ